LSIAKILEPTNRTTAETKNENSKYDTRTREKHIPCASVRAGNLVTCQKAGICHIVPESSQQEDTELQGHKNTMKSGKRAHKNNR
jgi:hypothetical protein